MRTPRVPRWIVASGLLALAVRLTYVLAYKRHAVPAGDAFYYHWQANLLAQGKWFVNPYSYVLAPHQVVPAADHPPLWTLVLAGPAALGVKGFLGQLIWACVVGSAGAVVVGLAARELAGPLVGAAAALAAAVFPDFWVNDGLLLSETLIPLVVGLIVLAAYRFHRRPGWRGAAWLGLAAGLGALTRAELALLLPILAVWVLVVARRQHLPGRRATGMLLSGAAAASLLVGPWVGFNLTRFDEPVLISSELGLTLAVSNCDDTYHGRLLGYWSYSCVARIQQPAGLDGPGQDATDRRVAVRYIRSHERRLPVVVGARLGRDLGVYRPRQQVDLEWDVLSRPRLPAWMGLAGFYAAALGALVGMRLLRRRGVTLLPMGAVVVTALAAAVIGFGQTRYRSTLEVVVVILAALPLAAVAGRAAGPTAGPAPA